MHFLEAVLNYADIGLVCLLMAGAVFVMGRWIVWDIRRCFKQRREEGEAMYILAKQGESEYRFEDFGVICPTSNKLVGTWTAHIEQGELVCFGYPDDHPCEPAHGNEEQTPEHEPAPAGSEARP